MDARVWVYTQVCTLGQAGVSVDTDVSWGPRGCALGWLYVLQVLHTPGDRSTRLVFMLRFRGPYKDGGGKIGSNGLLWALFTCRLS